MNSIRYEKDADNIVHVVFDEKGGPVNVMNASFRVDFAETITRLKAEPALAGVILRSAKSVFFAGADLNEMKLANDESPETLWAMAQPLKEQMRALETLGKPVVAAINGAALGGGWELCLCAQRRIALDNPKIQLGLPEVTLGLLPGGGGVVRMVRLLGLEAALPYLMEGQQFNPAKGLAAGLLHELATDEQDMLAKARAWILANAEAKQPWDQPGYRMPGGTQSSPSLAPKLMAVPALLREKTKGVMPAPEAILAAAVEGAQVDVDSALRIETRWFVHL
ncbi:MAG: enoyl-CoA hydratase/isomerase family protein, partial [Gammaproteobacteria bacterium]